MYSRKKWEGGKNCTTGMVGRHAMPGHPGPTGGNKFFWHKLIGVLLKLNLPKKIQKSRIGKIIFL
jgi:hypothetical protein